jgi:hypothetical protein
VSFSACFSDASPHERDRHAWETEMIRFKGKTPLRALDVTSALLRIALGFGFLFAVADRLGFWGPPGAYPVSWGTFTVSSSIPARLTLGALAYIFPCLGP